MEHRRYYGRCSGPDDFDKYAAESALRGLGPVALKEKRFVSLWATQDAVRDRFDAIDIAWSRGESLLHAFVDNKARALRSTVRVLAEGLATPAKLDVTLARVTCLQRTVLELHGRLTWLKLLDALHNPPVEPLHRHRGLMGAVVGRLDIAERFYRVCGYWAGACVWLISQHRWVSQSGWFESRRQCLLSGGSWQPL